MIFEQLDSDNFLLFAIKNYQNAQAVTIEDFYKDLNHFKYIKRLLKRYKNNNDLKVELLINHFIILYNVFGDAATPMLFYKIDSIFWPIIKTFIVFLNRLPDHPHCYIHDISIDDKCFNRLRGLINEED